MKIEQEIHDFLNVDGDARKLAELDKLMHRNFENFYLKSYDYRSYSNTVKIEVGLITTKSLFDINDYLLREPTQIYQGFTYYDG